jgi:hypothetical protein
MRLLKFVIYIGMLAAALVLGLPKWKVLIISLISSASYFPDFPFWPLWLPLGILVLGYLVYFLLAAGLRFQISFKHHVMVVVLFGAVLIARVAALLSPVPAGSWRDEGDAPPQLLMARAAARLKSSVDQYAQNSDNRTYPADPVILSDFLRDGKRMATSGFRSHALQAPVNLVVVGEATGPVLAVRPGDRAGTIYYALSEDQSRYWITLVGLSELPAGRPGIMQAADHQPIVLGTDSIPAEEEE